LHISLIQSSPNAIGSIYILRNFLYNRDYLNHLKEVIIEAIEEDSQYGLISVRAKATSWTKLLEIEKMRDFHVRILNTLINIYTLRAPNPNTRLDFSFNSSWGMKHEKGDLTEEHIHAPAAWSGAFYFEVPSDTFMYFADFNESIKLEDNMLILFPGTTKHRVSEHIGEKERISMAFNITWKI